MMMLLAALLAIDAILHVAIVARFGVKGNEPPLIFAIVDAALAIAVFLAVPYALWATLILVLVGTGGLVAAYRTIAHDKSIERVIMVLNVIIILFTIYLLFMH